MLIIIKFFILSVTYIYWGEFWFLAGKDLVSKQTNENEEKAIWGHWTQGQTIFPQQPCLQYAAELPWLPAILPSPVSTRTSSPSRPRSFRVLVAAPVAHQFRVESAGSKLLSSTAILGVPSRTHDRQMRFSTKRPRGFRGNHATIAFHISLDAIIEDFFKSEISCNAKSLKTFFVIKFAPPSTPY